MKHFITYILLIAFISCEKVETIQEDVFIDQRDGQQYNTIEVNGQTWLAENFNYRPGGYNYLETEYGILYSFDNAVNYCPQGWRLPTAIEWEDLGESLGNSIDLRSGEFNAKLAGWVQAGEYLNKGDRGAWWSSNEINNFATAFYIKTESDLLEGMFSKSSMLTVRYIKL